MSYLLSRQTKVIKFRKEEFVSSVIILSVFLLKLDIIEIHLRTLQKTWQLSIAF